MRSYGIGGVRSASCATASIISARAGSVVDRQAFRVEQSDPDRLRVLIPIDGFMIELATAEIDYRGDRDPLMPGRTATDAKRRVVTFLNGGK